MRRDRGASVEYSLHGQQESKSSDHTETKAWAGSEGLRAVEDGRPALPASLQRLNPSIKRRTSGHRKNKETGTGDYTSEGTPGLGQEAGHANGS